MKRRACNGFTLLEVLIALAILSTVALVALRYVGENQRQVAETVWLDEVLYAGRATMIQMIRQNPDDLVQRGTLAPDFPNVEWSSKIFPIEGYDGRRVEFTLIESEKTAQGPQRTLILEYIVP